MKNRTLLGVLSFIILFSFSCNKDNSENEETLETPEEVREPTDNFNKSITHRDSLINIQNAIQIQDSSYILVGGIQLDNETRDLIMKLDKYGNKLWAKVMRDTRSPNGLEHIFLDNNLLVGYRSHRYGYEKGEAPLLVYFDNEGNVVENFPIDNSIVGFDILQEIDGYIAIGSVNDFIVQKINKQGSILWTEKHAAATGFSISKFQDGSFITIGGSESGAAGEFLVKIDNYGKSIWSKPIRGYKVVALSDNGFVALTGHSNEKVELTRYDSSGNQIWKHHTGYEWSSVQRASTNSWLFNYDLDNFVYCLNIREELKIDIINNQGNVINSKSIKLIGTSIDDVNIIKTLDNGLFITYSQKVFKNSKFDGVTTHIKISNSELIGN